MASAYPGALDSFATNKANATATTTDHPTHHNDLADAVNKIEAELGTDPSGALATVKARLDSSTPALNDASAAVSIASLTDVTVYTGNVTGIVAGDVLFVEVSGFSNNGSGGNRTITLTLDFDSAFDMEWAFTAVSTVQPFRIFAEVAVVATNDSRLVMTALQTAQTVAGTLTVIGGTGSTSLGYDTTAQDLTGTTAVALKARSDATTATQELTVLGIVVSKFAS